MATIVTEEHFNDILTDFRPDMNIPCEQKKKILEVVNKYMAKEIDRNIFLLKKKRHLKLIHFSYAKGFDKYFYDAYLPVAGQFNLILYTDKEFRQMIKKLHPGVKVTIDKLYLEIGTISLVNWFNFVIYQVVTACLLALEKVGFEEMFNTQELYEYFDIKKCIDNSEVEEQYKDKSLSEVLKFQYGKRKNNFEWLDGIPYNNRIQYLFRSLYYYSHGTPERMFDALKSIQNSVTVL